MSLWNDRYRIETARKPDWDYSSASWYFVTICERNRRLAFGQWDQSSEEDGVTLNPLGEFVAACWLQVPFDYSDVVLDEWCVMPDHFHGLLWLDGTPLSRICGGFKGRVTRENNREPLGDFLWQDRFHDRVVRTEHELNRVRQYIRQNPTRRHFHDLE